MLWFSKKKTDQINEAHMRDIKTWWQGLCVQSCWSIAYYIPNLHDFPQNKLSTWNESDAM